MAEWMVAQTDEGVLRIEPTRRQALEWAKNLIGGPRVRQRVKYVEGSYEYLLSGEGADEEWTSVFIFRADLIEVVGVPSEERMPLYPHRDRPFEWRDRMDAQQ